MAHDTSIDGLLTCVPHHVKWTCGEGKWGGVFCVGWEVGHNKKHGKHKTPSPFPPHLLRRTPGHLFADAGVAPRQHGACNGFVFGVGQVAGVHRHRHLRPRREHGRLDAQLKRVRFGAVGGTRGQLVQGDGRLDDGDGGLGEGKGGGGVDAEAGLWRPCVSLPRSPVTPLTHAPPLPHSNNLTCTHAPAASTTRATARPRRSATAAPILQTRTGGKKGGM